MTGRPFARRLAAASAGALATSLLLASTVGAAEITDENEELEKIVWAVDAESVRDPELSVGGESVHEKAR